MGGMDWEKARRQERSPPSSYVGEREGRRRRRERDRRKLKPTDKQLHYIASLAQQLGRDMPKVETRDGASSTISSLKRHLGQ